MEYTNEEHTKLLHTIVENMVTTDDLAEIVENLATKDELAEVRSALDGLKGEVRGLRADMSDVHTSIATLTETVEGMKGFAKGLDDHGQRIRALEEHSSLQTRPA